MNIYIYIGGRAGGAAKGGAQVGGILLGVPPKPRPLSLFGVQGKAGEGGAPLSFIP